MRNGFYRPTSYNRFSAGLDASGRLVAWTHRIAGTPLRLKFGPLAKGIDDSLVDGAIDLPYAIRSEEHTSELQSRLHLVCRLLLEKKKNIHQAPTCAHTQESDS